MALLDNILTAYRVNASVYEDESGVGGPDGTNLGSPTTSTGAGGEDFLEYNGTTQSSYIAVPSLDLFTTDFTLAVRFKTGVTPGTTNVIAGLGNSADNDTAFIIRGSGSTTLQGWARNDAGTTITTATSTSDATLYNDSERIAVLSYNSATDDLTIEELVLGLTGSTTSTALTTLTTNRLGTGAWPRATATYLSDVDTSWVATWNKLLTAQDKTDLAATPWPFVATGLTLDSAPSTIAKGETGVQFVVSNPATGPTELNTTVTNSGDALTVTSVTGSDPYTIECTVPLDISKQAGSYAWTITVDAENVVSSSIPLTPQAGWSKVDLVSPLTTSGYMLEGYTGDAPVTGDDMEYETTTGLTPGADSEWVWDSAPTVDQTVARRVVQADGTVGDTEDITFTVGGGGGPIPAASRTSIYHIANHLRSLGTYTHQQCNELVVEWLVGESVVRANLNDMLYAYLGSLGYSGTMNERLKKWSEDT